MSEPKNTLTDKMSESSQPFVPNDRFLRRIPPVFYDSKTGKVMSAAFQNAPRTKRMSVNWTKLSTIKDTLNGYPGYRVASISAELCWSLEQDIEGTPSAENPAHCDVVGNKPQSVKRKFRDKAEYLRYPSPA